MPSHRGIKPWHNRSMRSIQKYDRSSTWANFSVLTVVHCDGGDCSVDGLDHW